MLAIAFKRNMGQEKDQSLPFFQKLNGGVSVDFQLDWKITFLVGHLLQDAYK